MIYYRPLKIRIHLDNEIDVLCFLYFRTLVFKKWSHIIKKCQVSCITDLLRFQKVSILTIRAKLSGLESIHV